MNFNFTNLKVGSLVEIEVISNNQTAIKLKTIVEEIVDGSTMRLFAPISKGVTYPLRINQSFSLITVHKYPTVDRYDILSCPCKILDKQKEGRISTIEIVKTGKFEQIQRRNYFRLPLIKTLKVSHKNKSYDVLSKDLSGNGFKGYISKKLPSDDEAVLHLDVGEKILDLRIKIIECNTDPEHAYRYEIRGSFINTKNSQLSALLKYIFSKQSESIRKQIDFREYASILDSDKNYSDFFSMGNMEKITRIAPVFLWGVTMIELGYVVTAFRKQDMGLNFFFGEFSRSFRPEFLENASLLAMLILTMSLIGTSLNIRYNYKTRRRVHIHYFLISAIAVATIVAYNIYT